MIASRIWTLARCLPVMIGDHIPQGEVHWEHFLQLLEILEIVFSSVVSQNTAAYLQVLIESNLTSFKELYRSVTVIPKMHYLLHVPRFIERYIVYTCMHKTFMSIMVRCRFFLFY